jgi:L-lactate dehydrogenase complex protein LldG
MSSRDEILSAIRSRRRPPTARPEPFPIPALPEDPFRTFAMRASLANAVVQELDDIEAVPAAIAEFLRARNMEAAVHLPPDAAMNDIDWSRAPGLERRRTPPGQDDAAVNFAPFAIAETGTLVYCAAPERPASWHFRPGLEIAILKASDIETRLEDVVAKIKARGGLPHTINLVTGPSRTGDIEQTLELGAHGPKALAIFIVKG